MPKQKRLKSKEAISPILATLLLIVIAVAAIVVTYAWIMTYMGSAGQSAGITLYKENVNWNSTAKKTYITIGNSGTANAKIVRLYVGTSSNNLINVTANTNIGSGIPLNAKSAVTIILDWPNSLADSWTPGNYYYFKVICETGQELPFQEQAAQ
ncbi:MAG: archaellin/type IV pilin N-terminal domain-containing protein [Candidatus Bathyarchaeales archaeon]